MSSKRYFTNPFPEFNEKQDSTSLTEVDRTFWTDYVIENALICMKQLKPQEKYCDGAIYTGNLGLIFMAYKMITSGQFSQIDKEVKKYLTDCLRSNLNYPYSKDISFLCGKGGLLIMEYEKLAAVCEPINFLKNGSDEIFVGRAGYLCGVLCLKKYLNYQQFPKAKLFSICNSIIQSGKAYAEKNSSPCPLMYAYHGTEYLGSAHGVAGIFQILLSFPEYLAENPEAQKLLKTSVDYILTLQKPNGNFPTIAVLTEEYLIASASKPEKDLIHWCHGAGGVIFLMIRAYLIWKEQKYLDCAIKCEEIIWQKGLLRKGPGICHGVGGNGYSHLALYRLTKEKKYLYRAIKFAEFLNDKRFREEARTPDSPFSLFEGLAGTICFIIDLLEPDNADYPLIPVF